MKIELESDIEEERKKDHYKTEDKRRETERHCVRMETIDRREKIMKQVVDRRDTIDMDVKVNSKFKPARTSTMKQEVVEVELRESTDGTSEDDDEEELLRDRVKALEEIEMRMERELREKKLRQEIERKKIELEKLKRKEEKKRKKEGRIMTLLKRESYLQNSLLEKEETMSVLDEDFEKEEEKPMMRQPIKAPTFQKPHVPRLVETQYDEWKREVEVMRDSRIYNDDMLKQAVRNSLTGNIRKVLLTMKADVTLEEIIDKLESIYGNVRTGESVIEEFYSSNQTKEESVSAWGLRLESLVQSAIEKGHIKEDQRETMLKSLMVVTMAHQ